MKINTPSRVTVFNSTATVDGSILPKFGGIEGKERIFPKIEVGMFTPNLKSMDGTQQQYILIPSNRELVEKAVGVDKRDEGIINMVNIRYGGKVFMYKTTNKKGIPLYTICYSEDRQSNSILKHIGSLTADLKNDKWILKESPGAVALELRAQDEIKYRLSKEGNLGFKI